MRVAPILGLILVLSFSLLNSYPEVMGAASGQCYSDKPVYQYNEIVTIIINTPTGINNTKILIYRPGGVVNTYVIGMIGPGVRPFPLGAAGPPAGTRSVVLMDGSTALFTAYYTVMESPPPTTPSATLQTVIQYQTVVVSTTITQPITVMRTETNIRTATSTVTLPPPMDLVYALFIVVIILVVALIFLVIRLVR